MPQNMPINIIFSSSVISALVQASAELILCCLEKSDHPLSSDLHIINFILQLTPGPSTESRSPRYLVPLRTSSYKHKPKTTTKINNLKDQTFYLVTLTTIFRLSAFCTLLIWLTLQFNDWRILLFYLITIFIIIDFFWYGFFFFSTNCFLVRIKTRWFMVSHNSDFRH